MRDRAPYTLFRKVWIDVRAIAHGGIEGRPDSMRADRRSGVARFDERGAGRARMEAGESVFPGPEAEDRMSEAGGRFRLSAFVSTYGLVNRNDHRKTGAVP
jgi:hypothetical protein